MDNTVIASQEVESQSFSGREVPLNTDCSEGLGSRVALVTKLPTRDLTEGADELEDLPATGRWVEVECMTNAGETPIMCASFYGISEYPALFTLP